MSNTIPFSAACERNKDPILMAISRYLMHAESVLEIGSGSAQHAVHFADANPHLVWQTSDQIQYIDGIKAQLSEHRLANVRQPFVLDVTQQTWLPDGLRFDLIYTANTLHIMNRDAVASFFRGLPQVLKPDACLIIYGPFNYQGQFTSDSNRVFDLSLRSRNCGSAIRDFEWIDSLARESNLELLDDIEMPANNRCLIFKLGGSSTD